MNFRETTVLLIVVLYLCVGCASGDVPPNRLTENEKTAQFELLFNGHNLEGWKQNGNAKEELTLADATVARLLTGTNNQTNKEAIIQLAGLTPLITTARIRGRKQIDKIQNLPDKRLSKNTLLKCQDNTSLHYMTRATPVTKADIATMCQELRLEVVNRLREGPIY